MLVAVVVKIIETLIILVNMIIITSTAATAINDTNNAKATATCSD